MPYRIVPTPLSRAINSEKRPKTHEMLKFLLKKGADVNDGRYINKIIETMDYHQVHHILNPDQKLVFNRLCKEQIKLLLFAGAKAWVLELDQQLLLNDVVNQIYQEMSEEELNSDPVKNRLIRAVIEHDVAEVEKLIKRDDVDPNSWDLIDSTCFKYCCSK